MLLGKFPCVVYIKNTHLKKPKNSRFNMGTAIGSLKLGKPSSKMETQGGVSLQNTGLVKAKLLEELVELEAQMDRLKSTSNTVDFSMMQTYKEMIHSRQVFYKELDR
ncbi:MAG: hypothetical protein ACJA0N_000804 [Pseudohongiellaceae bacterium]